MRIVCVGECTRDRYVDRGIDTVGGISLNFAVHARRSGAHDVALVSCTGTDAGAAAARAVLAREGVDASHLHQLPGATASQAIHLSAGGERTFPPGGYDPGVLATFTIDAGDASFIASFDVVVMPFFRQVEHLFDAAHTAAAGAKRVADLLDGEDLGPGLSGIEPLLNSFDLLFISGTEATVEQFRSLSRQTRTLLVVTRGAAGSSALSGGERFDEPAIPVPAEERLDTTGCGDAFQAAFTVEYFRHGIVRRALRAGALRASDVIRHLGAT
jgi:fructoselysine 6-kinase